MRGTIHEIIKKVQNWYPKARTAATYASADGDAGIVDRLGYSEALVLLDVGAIPTTGEVTVTVEEGDAATLSDAAAITGATFGTLTSAAGASGFQKVGRLRLDPRKRYLGAKVVVANQTIPCAVSFILGGKDKEPVGVTPTFDVVA